MIKKIYGLKLLAADGGSVTEEYERVFYPIGKWVEVPGNGAYMAITDGLNCAANRGKLLGFFECEEPTGALAPEGVVCFRKCRRLTICPIKKFSGSLYLSGCDLKGIRLPETVGGYLDLSGCDLKGIRLPKTVGRSLYLSGCDLKGIRLPETVGRYLDLSGCDLKGIRLPKKFKRKIIQGAV